MIRNEILYHVEITIKYPENWDRAERIKEKIEEHLNRNMPIESQDYYGELICTYTDLESAKKCEAEILKIAKKHRLQIEVS